MTISFKLPDDADYGEQYDIEIIHSGDETFTNIDDDETGRLMQAYLFTRGIDNGYIKIDDVLTTTSTTTIITTTTTESTITTTVTTITSEPPVTTNPVEYTFGDINEDNMVDAVDASLVLQYYAYASTGGEKSSEEFFDKNTEK